ncbi:LysR family transcriptional regulator [Paraburkholderia sp. CNPSo 3157]|uniref:LysR family transcriptional regulator n=1 Tax=Paraburkholderia franconis TaxID=2654983 RepID=A0A7X1NIM2_9BURK|nr:LysR family transcriptional regulator [Paraburkholderia franconis]MPW22537.1 LysR family transcriptional regulator [Paraburkholderia franconis]
MKRTNATLQRSHIEALVAIADVGSVHRAARGLGVAQPVLSRLLADAEHRLGARLFERSSQGSQPTPLGETVLAHARSVMRAMERMTASAASARLPIRLGCIPRAMHTLIPPLLARMYPEARKRDARDGDAAFRCNVVEGSSGALFALLEAGELDFAILRHASTARSDETRIERLYAERTVIVCSSDHPLVRKQPVRIADLAAHDWILPHADTTSRIAFDQFWTRHRLPFIEPVLETRSFESNIGVVAHTRLLSIAPEPVARRYMRFGMLSILEVERPLPSSPIMLGMRMNAHEDPALKRFRKLLQETANALPIE